jgi:hypothetical protein
MQDIDWSRTIGIWRKKGYPWGAPHHQVLELSQKGKVKGLMACIDFKGAFDSICHEFIWQLLEKMGVGKNLIGHTFTREPNQLCSILAPPLIGLTSPVAAGKAILLPPICLFLWWKLYSVRYGN